jgi:cytochrome P450
MPPKGAYVGGRWIPGNTIVACNAWTIHRCRDVFGEDVETYRPERWLEASGEQRNAMSSALLVFGAGAHLCIGMNIAKMEMWKLVPSVLKCFEVKAYIFGFDSERILTKVRP